MNNKRNQTYIFAPEDSKASRASSWASRIILGATLSLTAGLGLSVVPAATSQAYAQEASSGVTVAPVYLDSLNPTRAKVGYDRLRKNQNLSGRPITAWVNGQRTTLSHGYVAHAPADLVFDISSVSGERNIFSCTVGIDADQGGDVVFRFYLDDSSTPAYTTGRIDRWSTQRVNIKTQGARTLRIVVDSNGSNTEDHSFVANAEFVHKDNLPAEIPFGELKKQFGQTVSLSQADAFSEQNLQQVGLLSFIDGRADKLFSMFVDHPEYKEIYDWISQDPEALSYLFGENPDGGNLEGFFNVLNKIVQKDKTVKTNSDHKRLALACALTFATPKGFWQNQSKKIEPVERYMLYRSFYEQEGAMMLPMRSLNMTSLRNVVSCWVTNEDLIWLREKVKRENPQALKDIHDLASLAPKYINYRPYNNFGDSVQGGEYYGEDPDLERIVEYGGVCGAISKFDVAIMNAFGVPAQVVGQPGHAAMIYLNEDKAWFLTNAIYGWDRTQGGTLTTFAYPGEGLWKRGPNTQFNSSYNNLEQGARKLGETSYRLADVYFQMARMSSDPYARRAYLNSAINANKLYMPAYYQLITDEMRQKTPNEDALVATALRAFAVLKDYPKCAEDIAYAVEPYIKSQDNKIKFYGAIKDMYDRTVPGNEALHTPSIMIMRTEEFRALVNKAQSVMGTFSFDGPYANRLQGATTAEEFSLDGGKTWHPVVVENQLLTQDQINSISAKNGIKLRVKGTASLFTLPISSMPKPDKLKVLHDEHAILGIDSDMEYSVDGGTTWYTTSTMRPNFLDVNSVLVRYRKSGNKLESQPAQYTFAAPSAAAQTAVLHAGVHVVSVSSEEAAQGQGVQNAINGDTSNFWSNAYAGTDLAPSITLGLNDSYTLKSFVYTPRQDGNQRGNITNAEVYTSEDGQDWKLAGTAHWTYNNPKQAQTFTFAEPVKARFVRLDIKDALKDAQNSFGAVAGMADIRFTTTQEDAARGRASLSEQLYTQEAGDLKASVQKLVADATSTASALADPAVDFAGSDQISALVDQRAALKNKLDSFAETYANKLEGTSQLSDLKELYAQASGAYKQLALDTLAYNQAYSDMSIRLGKSNASASEKDRMALKIKLEAQNNKIIENLTNRFGETLKLNTSTYQDSQLNAIREAYYNVVGQPAAVVDHFKAQLDSLKKILENDKKTQVDREVEDFLRNFDWIINNANPADLTKDNWRHYADEFYRCKKAYELLSPEAHESRALVDAKELFNWHPVITWDEANQKYIFGQQEAFDYYLKPFQSSEAQGVLLDRIKELNRYRKAMPQNTPDETARYQRLKNALVAAKKISDNPNLSTNDYYKAIADLDVVYMQVRRDDGIAEDAQKRLIKFRTQYRWLLTKQPVDVKPSDLSSIKGAIKNYDKLPAAARKVLKSDREYLEALKQAASIPAEKRDSSLEFWKAQYKALMSTKANEIEGLVDELHSDAEALYAAKPSAETPEAYKNYCEGFATKLAALQNKSKAYILAQDAFITDHAELLNKRASDFTLENHQDLKRMVEKATADLESLTSDFKLPAQKLKDKLKAYSDKLAELDAEAQKNPPKDETTDNQEQSGALDNQGAESGESKDDGTQEQPKEPAGSEQGTSEESATGSSSTGDQESHETGESSENKDESNPVDNGSSSEPTGESSASDKENSQETNPSEGQDTAAGNEEGSHESGDSNDSSSVDSSENNQEHSDTGESEHSDGSQDQQGGASESGQGSEQDSKDSSSSDTQSGGSAGSEQEGSSKDDDKPVGNQDVPGVDAGADQPGGPTGQDGIEDASKPADQGGSAGKETSDSNSESPEHQDQTGESTNQDGTSGTGDSDGGQSQDPSADNEGSAGSSDQQGSEGNNQNNQSSETETPETPGASEGTDSDKESGTSEGGSVSDNTTDEHPNTTEETGTNPTEGESQGSTASGDNQEAGSSEGNDQRGSDHSGSQTTPDPNTSDQGASDQGSSNVDEQPGDGGQSSAVDQSGDGAHSGNADQSETGESGGSGDAESSDTSASGTSGADQSQDGGANGTSDQGSTENQESGSSDGDTNNQNESIDGDQLPSGDGHTTGEPTDESSSSGDAGVDQGNSESDNSGDSETTGGETAQDGANGSSDQGDQANGVDNNVDSDKENNVSKDKQNEGSQSGVVSNSGAHSSSVSASQVGSKTASGAYKPKHLKTVSVDANKDVADNKSDAQTTDSSSSEQQKDTHQQESQAPAEQSQNKSLLTYGGAILAALAALLALLFFKKNKR